MTKMVFGADREKEASNITAIKKAKYYAWVYYQRRIPNKSADNISAHQPQPEILYSVPIEGGNIITIGRMREKLVSCLKKSKLSEWLGGSSREMESLRKYSRSKNLKE